MQRKICTPLVALTIALLGWAGMASASESVISEVSGVGYYDVRSTDNVLRLTNPTTQSGGVMCAMIYVFDFHEQLQECCGCRVTNDGLRVLSVKNDLTSNPLTGISLTQGGVEVISALPNVSGACNPGASFSAIPAIDGTIAHPGVGGWPGVGEVVLSDGNIGANELSVLTPLCHFIQTNGTRHGVCTCGVGDNSAPQPGAGGR